MSKILFQIIFCLSLFGYCLVGLTYAQDVSLPSNVDVSKVQSARLDLQNQERTKMGLVGYTGNELLNTSAQERAEYLKDLGTTTHKRESTDGYYNYRSIKDWFADEGIGFHDEEGTMFSESLGRGYYSCKKSDCTDTLIAAIKKTFAFFMSEKGRRYQPHYKAIVSKEFTSLGLGISIVGKKYYLVSHYAKNVVPSKMKIELAKK